jgi:protein-disulfide isomerase
MAKAKKRVRKSQQQKSSVSPLLIVGVAVGAVLLVIGLILLGNRSPAASAPVDVSQFPAKGAEDAPVTMVEYSDYGCPHCRDFNLDKVEQLEAEYVDTGRMRYVAYPYHLGSPDRALAVEAAWCAADQDRFFEYQTALFQNFGNPLVEPYLNSLAQSIELDQAAFAECLSSRTHRGDVESARQAAARQGVSSTPTFFINDRRVEGNQPFQVFQSIIEQELAAAQQ